jgi:CSLREA domain-containing protein
MPSRTKFQVMLTAALLIAGLALALAPIPSALAANFTVNSTGDEPDESAADGICKIAGSNQCTLRAAIMQANASPGADVISFNVGTATIAPLTMLPILDDNETTIRGAGKITLDGGPGGIGFGLFIANADYNKIQGLTLVNFDTAVVIEGTGDHIAQWNTIGTDGDGNNDSQERNVIHSNTVGVAIIGTSTDNDFAAFGNTIAGNRIGTNAAGDTAMPNDIGIQLIDAESNTIGSDGDGVSDTLERNIISGNTHAGIEMQSSDGNFVTGNFIGTAANGAAALGNGDYGIVLDSSDGNAIGWSGEFPPTAQFIAATRNVISGNGDGVDDAPYVDSGILLYESGSNIISRNYIGTNAAGNAALGAFQVGIHALMESNNNTIGAPILERNVISGNREGVVIEMSENNHLWGNRIGTNAAGTAALGNQFAGVRFVGASNNLVGGNSASEGNTIAFNGQHGIVVDGVNSTTDTILSNRIYSNGNIGIELGDGGPAPFVTPNDAGDADSGGNNLMNFPVVTGAGLANSSVTLNAKIDNGLPFTTFKVQFFASPTCDSSGHGEGQTYLGMVTGTTNGSGYASFQATLPAQGAQIGHVITATATAGSNTSEFSACKTIQIASLNKRLNLVDTPWPYFYIYKGDPGPDDPEERINLVVEGPDGVVSDMWYAAGDVCFGGMCAIGLDTPLREGVPYAWRVRFATGDRIGAFSENRSLMVDLTPPAAPAPQAVDGGSTRPRFNWASVLDGTRYHIEVATDPGFEHLVIDEVAGAAKFKPNRAQSLIAGMTYYWRVQAQDQAGNWSPFSEGASFTIER